MKLFNHRGTRSFVLALLILLGSSLASPAHAAASRDILWSLINSCLDPTVADYCGTCMAPRVDTSCGAGKSCKDTTEVWALTEAFVAMRDRKMCDCPGEFVHGLVMPRAKVAGVEDPRRPVGIWSFAWKLACVKIPEDSTRALVVNPAGMRDQDQLHVHILRLQPDARLRFSPKRSTCVRNLDEVWGAASRVAAEAGLDDYGVLVTLHPEGGFLVLVDQVSPEKKYTVVRCGKK